MICQKCGKEIKSSETRGRKRKYCGACRYDMYNKKTSSAANRGSNSKEYRNGIA